MSLGTPKNPLLDTEPVRVPFDHKDTGYTVWYDDNKATAGFATKLQEEVNEARKKGEEKNFLIEYLLHVCVHPYWDVTDPEDGDRPWPFTAENLDRLSTKFLNTMQNAILEDINPLLRMLTESETGFAGSNHRRGSR